MGVTSYYSFGGEILGEETSGVRRDYLTDALGSVTATVTGVGVVENTYRYKPYGEQLAKTGTGNDPKFLWNGKWGYRINNNSHYVRNRTYRPSSGIWLTKDILFYVFKTVNYYLYSENNPIVLFDFTGKDPEGVWIPRKPVNGTIKKNMIADCASGNRAVTQCDVNTGTTISLICDTPFEYKCGAERDRKSVV